IGFFASGKLKRINATGGSPLTLADATAPRGGTWSRDGTILFSRAGPLVRVPASGGEAVAVTTIESNQTFHRFPQFLPDGKHFLFVVSGNADTQGIHLGSLDGGATRRLTSQVSVARFLAPDRIVLTRQGVIVAQRIDVDRGELQGEPEAVADLRGSDSAARVGGFSASQTGTLAYRIG